MCGTPMTPAESAASYQNDYQNQNGYQNQNNYQNNYQNQNGSWGTGTPDYSGGSIMSGNFGSYNPAGTNIPPEYKPISMWGYVGYSLLFNIPCCIGLILVLVFAFGGTENLNLKNYARGYLLTIVIVLAICIIFYLITMLFGISLVSSFSRIYY